jgi:hypothetical protein
MFPVLLMCGQIRTVLLNNNPLFVMLQQNMDTIKVENDVDGMSEEDCVGVKTEEVYIPSAFSVKKTEPEVSLVSRRVLWCCFMYSCMPILTSHL